MRCRRAIQLPLKNYINQFLLKDVPSEVLAESLLFHQLPLEGGSDFRDRWCLSVGRLVHGLRGTNLVNVLPHLTSYNGYLLVELWLYAQLA